MLNMNFLNAAVTDGRVIIDTNGIIKSYAWHVKDTDFRVTFTQSSGYRGKITTIYQITDGESTSETLEYSRALELTEAFLRRSILLN